LISIGNQSGWKIAVTDGTVKVFPVAYTALENTIAGASEAGYGDYIVREGYRTNDEQTALFNARMEKLSSQYSGDLLIEATKKIVNYPGTSEYQSGMSFRMALYNKSDATVAKQKFQETPQGQWFTENCWKYGLIFRFPSDDYPNSNWEDKSYKTGVSLHLDLYRYVAWRSRGHADHDYCLVVYIEVLIDHPHICIYKDGHCSTRSSHTAEDASTTRCPCQPRQQLHCHPG
jgi:LAS superfamily LD-carboxypeptidase LdcB